MNALWYVRVTGCSWPTVTSHSAGCLSWISTWNRSSPRTLSLIQISACGSAAVPIRSFPSPFFKLALRWLPSLQRLDSFSTICIDHLIYFMCIIINVCFSISVSAPAISHRWRDSVLRLFMHTSAHAWSRDTSVHVWSRANSLWTQYSMNCLWELH